MSRVDPAAQRSEDRKALLQEIAAMVAEGELHFGEALRILRRGVLGLSRPRFAQITRLSVSALAKLEDDPRANPTVETLNRVFAPFRGRVALIFPMLEERAALDDERSKRRAQLRALLDRSKKTRRA